MFWEIGHDFGLRSLLLGTLEVQDVDASTTLGGLLMGVLTVEAEVVGVYVRAPDLLETPMCSWLQSCCLYLDPGSRLCAMVVGSFRDELTLKF